CKLSTWVLAPCVLLAFAKAAEAAPTSVGPVDDSTILSDVTKPLPVSTHDKLASLPQEQPPPTPRFYFRSNEWRQDLLRPHLEGLGGVLIGVGSDQNYTMAAMAKSSVLVLIDFDVRVPLVHRLYSVLVPLSATPEELVSRFTDEEAPRTEELIRE